MKKRTTRPDHWQAAKKPHAHSALTIESVPVQDLRPSPNNSRDYPKEQIEKLKRAIKQFGFLVPVLIDDRNRVIVGHARMEAAKELGLAEIPCIRIRHLSEAQKASICNPRQSIGRRFNLGFSTPSEGVRVSSS